MKDYYSILSVQRTATTAEIKKVYRRLAFVYHPDKNSDPRAEQLFKEINEAYDVLGDPEKRKTYDDQLDNPFAELLAEEIKPKHRDPAYHRKRPGPPRKSAYQKRMELMASYLLQCRVILYFSLGFCFFLLLDFFLPFRTNDSTVQNIDSYRGRRTTRHYLLLQNGMQFRISDYDALNFIAGEAITVYSTRILNVQARVEAESGYISRLPISIYGNFVFAPVLLLIFSFAGAISKNVERIFNMAVVSLFVLILCGIFLWIS